MSSFCVCVHCASIFSSCVSLFGSFESVLMLFCLFFFGKVESLLHIFWVVIAHLLSLFGNSISITELCDKKQIEHSLRRQDLPV